MGAGGQGVGRPGRLSSSVTPPTAAVFTVSVLSVAGAGQPLAAEGLHTDHRADHAAVDVDVADARRAHDLVGEALNAAVDAQREPIAGVAQPLQHALELLAAVPADVKDRAEDFDGGEFIER